MGSQGYANSHAARGARRRERTRDSILDATEQLLATQPAASLPVEQIATEAGVAPATIYVHFGTKDGLVAAVVDRLLTQGIAQLAAAYDETGNPYERIVAIQRTYRCWLHRHPAAAKYLASSGLTDSTSEIEQLVGDRIRQMKEHLEELLQEAIDAGEIRDLNCRLATHFLFGAWNGVAALAHRTDGTQISIDEVDEAMELGSLLITKGILP